MRTLAMYSIKGGVGKTSTAVNVAYLASRTGLRTLLWDLDPQAAATYVFRVRARVRGGSEQVIRGGRPLEDAIRATDYDGLDLLPADFTYRHMDLLLGDAKRPGRHLEGLLRPLGDQFDLLVLDCPPSISLVSENVLRAADTVLVPIIPTSLSVRTLDQLTDFLPTVRKAATLFPFFSMVDRRKRLHREIVDALPQRRDDIARTSIPSLSVIEQMAANRAPVPTYAPRSVATRRYEELTAEVLAR